MNILSSTLYFMYLFLGSRFSHALENGDLGKSVRDKIVGGNVPFFGEYPFVVSIKEKDIGRRICGGSIIAPVFVMTACHCICLEEDGKTVTKSADSLVIEAGLQIYPRSSAENSIFTQWRNVSDVFVHPDCKKSENVFGWDGDFAVLTTSSKLIFGQHIKSFKIFALNRAALREGMDDIMYTGEDCTLIGWGSSTIASGKYNADVLKAIKVTIIDYLKCQKKLCSLQQMFCNFTHFYRRRVCLQPDMNASVCIGDGGGPLVCRGFVWGILNWSPSCGKPQSPIIFSKIEDHLEYYLKFIFAVSSSPATTVVLGLPSFVFLTVSFNFASVLIKK